MAMRHDRRLMRLRGLRGLRRVTCAAATLALGATATSLLLAPPRDERWDQWALLALTGLAFSWSRLVLTRAPSSALAATEISSALLLSVAIGPDNAMPVILAGLTFRSLYGTRRAVWTGAAGYAVAHLLAAAISHGRFPDYPFVVALTSTPLLMLVPAAAFELARGLRAGEAGTRREKALSALVGSYVVPQGLDDLARRTEEAVRGTLGERLGAVEVTLDPSARAAARERFGREAAHFPIAEHGAISVLPWEPLSRAERRWLETVADQLALAVGGLRARAAAATQRIQHLVDRTGGVALLVDSSLVVQSATAGAQGLLDETESALKGRAVPDLVHRLDRERARAALTGHVHMDDRAPERITVRLRASGPLRWAELSVADLSRDPDVGAFVVQLRDVTARVALEDDVRLRADHDALTGLPNRHRFERALADLLRSDDRQFAVVEIDVDAFRQLNEQHGLAVGDQVIAEVARRLAIAVASRGLVARMTGDAFAVLLRDVASGEAGRLCVEHILGCLRDPLDAGPGSLRVSATAGLARPVGDLRTAASLVTAASVALGAARATAPGTCVVFAPVQHRERLESARLQAELAVAVGRDELELDFQPVVDARTGVWRGAEALVRWRHPVLGRLGPNRFIELAEQSDLIVAVGNWVLHEACRQLAEWRADGAVGDEFCVGVNVSGVQLRRPDLVERVRETLAVTGVPARALVIEVTETAMIDVAAAQRRLQDLRALGVRVAIDDFGTGESSLAYLKDLPADVLKLPRTFVRDSGTCERSAAIVAGLVALAQRLELVVLAEGVETRAQRAAVDAAGCRLIQGYLFAAPLRPSELAGMMRSAGPARVQRGRGRAHGLGDPREVAADVPVL